MITVCKSIKTLDFYISFQKYFVNKSLSIKIFVNQNIRPKVKEWLYNKVLLHEKIEKLGCQLSNKWISINLNNEIMRFQIKTNFCFWKIFGANF